MLEPNFFTSHLETFEEKLPSIINDEMKDNETAILDMNRAQMWDGKDIFGKDIRPFYSEDPFFKSKESALRYARWKQKITPNSKRNPDAPNLFINGHFHKSLTLQVRSDDIVFKSESPLGQKIETKFPNVEGLTEENLQLVRDEYLKPRLIEELKNELS
jgi:hypothetical protein